jgi:hypothetical protein
MAVPDWRSSRKTSNRTGQRPALTTQGDSRRSQISDELWEDRAQADAEQLVGLLFVAAEPGRRSEIAETLRMGPARLARACAVLNGDPPRELRPLDTGDQLKDVRRCSVCVAVSTPPIVASGADGSPQGLRWRNLQAVADSCLCWPGEQPAFYCKTLPRRVSGGTGRSFGGTRGLQVVLPRGARV